jgi:hypothetical protein
MALAVPPQFALSESTKRAKLRDIPIRTDDITPANAGRNSNIGDARAEYTALLQYSMRLIFLDIQS